MDGEERDHHPLGGQDSCVGRREGPGTVATANGGDVERLFDVGAWWWECVKWLSINPRDVATFSEEYQIYNSKSRDSLSLTLRISPSPRHLQADELMSGQVMTNVKPYHRHFGATIEE